MKIYRHKVRDGSIITFIWKDDKFYIYTIFGTIITNRISRIAGSYYVFYDLNDSSKSFEIYLLDDSALFFTKRGMPIIERTSIANWNRLDSDQFGIRWWIDEESLKEFHKIFDVNFYGP